MDLSQVEIKRTWAVPNLLQELGYRYYDTLEIAFCTHRSLLDPSTCIELHNSSNTLKIRKVDIYFKSIF